MIIASDLNGTLTTGSPILAVARWVKKHQPEHYPAGFISSIFLSYMKVKLGMMAIDIWADINMRRVLMLIDSPTPELLDKIMLSVARDEFWKKRRQIPIDLLQEYHHNGAEIVIISATYEPAVQKFAGLIGEERTSGIGTPISIIDGTVVLADKITTRKEKINRLESWMGSGQIDVALGDTFADIPFMELAKKAIAVYPDRKLLTTALERNWQIIN